MAWPKTTDYNEAVQNPRFSLADEELRAGEVARMPLGLPLLWSGNFADVYKIRCPTTGNTWALKCFTREVRGLQERYRSIAAHLEEARLPFTVDFQYLEQGIRIAGAWFPVLKMRWVEGLTLSQFVEEHLERPKNLRMLLDLWVKLAARLRQVGVAHADLQHGNVLLVPMTGGQLALRLIDYDGMYVPALAGTPSGEVGHPAYQHPQRLREGTYNPEVDRFSHLAIYSAIRCLAVEKADMWQRFNNGDNLLFRESDFRCPGASELFHTLWALRNPAAHALVGRLILATQMPLERVPLLDDVVSHGGVRPLGREEEQQVRGVLDGGAALRESVPVAGGEAPWWTSAQATPAELAPGGSRMAAALRWPLRVSLRVVRWVDRLLGVMVREENTIQHNFLRVALTACIVLAVVLSIDRTVSHLKAQREAAKAQQEAALRAEQGAAQAKQEAAARAEQEAATAKQEAAKAQQEAAARAEQEAAKAKQEAAAKAEQEAATAKQEAAARARQEVARAKQAWSAALAAADKYLLKMHASQQFAAAEKKAESAEKQALTGKAEEAATAYADALDTLNRAIAEALLARTQAEAKLRQGPRTFQGHTGEVFSVAFSPDGRQVLTGSRDRTAILWDASTGQNLHTFQGHTRVVTSVAFSPDNRQILTGSDDRTAILWDAATGENLRTFREHNSSITSVAFSPDGRQVLTGSADTTAILWDAATGQKLRTFQGHTRWVTSVAFSPDGRQVLTGSWDETAILWDAATGEKLRTFPGHSNGVQSVAFSPDGRQVLTGSDDKTAILWDAATGEKLRTFQGTFQGHKSYVWSVAFSPDCRQVLTGSDDKTAILWDAATGEMLRTFPGHSNGVQSVAFSPDGRQVLTGSLDGTAILWDVSDLTGGKPAGEITPPEPKPSVWSTPDPLHLRAIPPQTVEAGRPLEVVISVENAGRWAGKVRFSLAEGAAAGARIDPQSGIFTWRPAKDVKSGNMLSVAILVPKLAKTFNLFLV